jgi:tetratricopeptide (TPR) repeat protein
LTEIFTIQKAIASAICDALGATLANMPATRNAERPAPSMDAYRAYLRARFHRNQWTAEGFSKSIEYFQKALDYEPNYVQALAGISEAHILRAILGDVAPEPYFTLAREAAERAIALSQSSAQAYLSLAWIYHLYDWQWKAGDAQIRQALALEPNFAEAHHLNGIALGVRGRLRDASQSFARALQLDPLSLVIHTHAALIPYFSGDFSGAEGQLRSALSMDRNFVEAHWILGWIYECQQKYEQALNEFQTAIDLSKENPIIMGDKACVHALMGNSGHAREILSQLGADIKWVRLLWNDGQLAQNQ